MPDVFLINTNKTNNLQCEADMLREQKCAAYYKQFKYQIDLIQKGDMVFLYSSGEGIIARGIATGIVEMKDYQGHPDEEHYMLLDRFEPLQSPMLASEITTIIQNQDSGYEIKWNATSIIFPYSLGIKVWQKVTQGNM